MGFGFLRKKKDEVLTVEEAENKVLELIQNAEDGIELFVSEKKDELKNSVEKMVFLIENLNTNALHPRLRNQAQNFVSAMLNLWKPLPDFKTEEVFEEVSKRMEKMAFMKLKYFRMLFSVNPPEIEEIDLLLKGIANIIGEVEEKKKEVKLDELTSTLELIERLKAVVEKMDKTDMGIEETYSRIQRLKEEQMMGNEDQDKDGIISDLKHKEKILIHEIERREAEIHKKIAQVRKPLKIYAHMIGVKLNMDTNRFLSEMDEIRSLAGGTITEIKKGNIGVKEKKQKEILKVLGEISSGEFEKEAEEIKELKKRLKDLKNELKKVQPENRDVRIKKKKKELEKKLTIMTDMKRDLDVELVEITEKVERKLSEIMGKKIRLSVP